MAKYFFNTIDGGWVGDDEGLDLPNVAVARTEAIRFAGMLLNDNPDLLWDGRDFRVEVTDESQRVLVTVIMLAVDTGSVNKADRNCPGSPA